MLSNNKNQYVYIEAPNFSSVHITSYITKTQRKLDIHKYICIENEQNRKTINEQKKH